MRIGLALSGGGFRATLYHLGVVRFLRDADLLPHVSHITSVSGGSVLAGHLALNWERYCGSTEEFDAVAQAILDFVALDVRNRIVRRYPLLLLAAPCSRLVLRRDSRMLTQTWLLKRYYERYLFGDACLHQLPVTPETHFLCTNVSEGGLSSFTRSGLLIQRRLPDGNQGMQAHRGGLAKVATAVTASSAFPAFFPPLELRASDIGASEGEFSTQYFTDGGIFDNLGVRMFDFLGAENKTRIDRDDFTDLPAALETWNRCRQHNDRSALGRLAEIAASCATTEKAAWTTPVQQPEQLIVQLNLLTCKGRLHQDAQLRQLLQQSAGELSSSTDADVSGDDAPQGDLDIIANAFRQAAGHDCLQSRRGVCDVILASDVGKVFAAYGSERTPGLLSTALRSSDILMNRVWQLERARSSHERHCVFMDSTNIVRQENDPAALHPEIQVQVSRVRTDMDRFRKIEISGLIRHGYCVARQACRSLPPALSQHVVDGPAWDPTERVGETATSAKSASSGAFENVAKAAHVLRRSTQRRLWRSLLPDFADWATWVYIPFIVLLVGVLPMYGYRMYRHARLEASLSRAVVETREDFERMLELLEFGPPSEFSSMPVEDAGTLSPRLAEEGLDIVSDVRITDLRQWLANSGGRPRRVFMYRHVLVRKVSESSGIPGLRLQSLWDSPDLAVHCGNTELRPVVRHCNQSATGDPGGPFAWEIALDVSDVSIGETVEVIVSVMHSAQANGPRSKEKAWGNFEVDAQPEVAISWILLPKHYADASFSVVRWRTDVPEIVEMVRPTHETRIPGRAVMSWAVVHPEPGFVYSSRWGSR